MILLTGFVTDSFAFIGFQNDGIPIQSVERLIAYQRPSFNLKTNLRVKYFQMDPCKDIPKEACALKIGFK